jgi:hypothetical protein
LRRLEGKGENMLLLDEKDEPVTAVVVGRTPVLLQGRTSAAG